MKELTSIAIFLTILTTATSQMINLDMTLLMLNGNDLKLRDTRTNINAAFLDLVMGVSSDVMILRSSKKVQAVVSRFNEAITELLWLSESLKANSSNEKFDNSTISCLSINSRIKQIEMNLRKYHAMRVHNRMTTNVLQVSINKTIELYGSSKQNVTLNTTRLIEKANVIYKNLTAFTTILTNAILSERNVKTNLLTYRRGYCICMEITSTTLTIAQTQSSIDYAIKNDETNLKKSITNADSKNKAALAAGIKDIEILFELQRFSKFLAALVTADDQPSEKYITSCEGLLSISGSIEFKIFMSQLSQNNIVRNLTRLNKYFGSFNSTLISGTTNLLGTQKTATDNLVTALNELVSAFSTYNASWVTSIGRFLTSSVELNGTIETNCLCKAKTLPPAGPCGTFKAYNPATSLHEPALYGFSAGTFNDQSQVYVGTGNSGCGGATLSFARITTVTTKAGAHMSCSSLALDRFDNKTAKYLVKHKNLQWISASSTNYKSIPGMLMIDGYDVYLGRINLTINGVNFTQMGKVYLDNLRYRDPTKSTEQSSSRFEVLTCVLPPEEQCGQLLPYDPVTAITAPATLGFPSGKYKDSNPIYPGIGASNCSNTAVVPARIYTGTGLVGPGAYSTCDFLTKPFFDNTTAKFYKAHPNLKWISGSDTNYTKITGRLSVVSGTMTSYVGRVNLTDGSLAFNQIGKIQGNQLYYYNPMTSKEESIKSFEILTCVPHIINVT